MAGRDRMTIEEVVRQVLREEHGDVIRESVKLVARENMEAEVSELIGAQLGSRRDLLAALQETVRRRHQQRRHARHWSAQPDFGKLVGTHSEKTKPGRLQRRPGHVCLLLWLLGKRSVVLVHHLPEASRHVTRSA